MSKSVSDILSEYRPIKLMRLWKECSGPIIWNQAKFMGIRQSASGLCLYLEVKDPMWRQELQYQMKSLLSSFQEILREAGFQSSEIPQHYQLISNASLPQKIMNSKIIGQKVRV